MATPRPASAKRTLRLICEALEDRNLLDAGLLANLAASPYPATLTHSACHPLTPSILTTLCRPALQNAGHSPHFLAELVGLSP